MASLNLDLNYSDNVKTLRLAARLGPGSQFLPIALWLYTGKHHPEDGRLALLEAELELVCGWWGEKGACMAALIDLGFLERREGFFQVHDWLDHSGHLAVFKKRAKNAAKKRWSKAHESSNASSNTKVEDKQSPSSAVHSSSDQSNPPTPFSPSATSKATANGTPATEAAKAKEMLKQGTLKPGHYDVPDDEIMGPNEFAKIKEQLGRKTHALVNDDVF